MRFWLADRLREVASKIDGRRCVPWGWYMAQVEGTNRYVATAEGYIIALETEVGAERAREIRAKHPGRFDTKPLWDAGAWRQWRS